MQYEYALHQYITLHWSNTFINAIHSVYNSFALHHLCIFKHSLTICIVSMHYMALMQYMQQLHYTFVSKHNNQSNCNVGMLTVLAAWTDTHWITMCVHDLHYTTSLKVILLVKYAVGCVVKINQTFICMGCQNKPNIYLHGLSK